MKTWSVFFVLAGLASCQSSNSPQGTGIDPLTKKFILRHIAAENAGKLNVVYFIYPSFCGACTDSVMYFIHQHPLHSFHPYYIFPKTDSSRHIPTTHLHGEIKYVDDRVLGRHGLSGGSNKMFVFDDTVCIYYSKLSSEDITRARSEVAALDSMYRN